MPLRRVTDRSAMCAVKANAINSTAAETPSASHKGDNHSNDACTNAFTTATTTKGRKPRHIFANPVPRTVHPYCFSATLMAVSPRPSR